jgi:aryl-phospho-beta-D-glucosidase BglC (GH1 family)
VVCKALSSNLLKRFMKNSSQAVKEVIERARESGLGVLIGFHAACGGANCDAHSGISSGNAEFVGE